MSTAIKCLEAGKAPGENELQLTTFQNRFIKVTNLEL